MFSSCSHFFSNLGGWETKDKAKIHVNGMFAYTYTYPSRFVPGPARQSVSCLIRDELVIRSYEGLAEVFEEVKLTKRKMIEKLPLCLAVLI